MQPKYILNEATHCVTPVRRNDVVALDIDGQEVNVRISWQGRYQCQLEMNGTTHTVYAAQDDKKLFIHFAGRTWQLDIFDEFSEAGEAGGSSEGLVKAPMPGVVVEISVEAGQPVEEGQTLMLIESMKLQMEIKAKVSGVVRHLGVDGPGAGFEKGSMLAEIEVAGEEQ
ncbi:MAG: acetyl-CoA carboxylase biotin carboxyl carrier protein subunit [Endozoicomonas sp.]